MRRQEGFTLIELLITVLIIGLLASIGLAAYNGQRQKAHLSRNVTELRQLETAIHAARIATGKTLTEITGRVWTADFCHAGNPAGVYPANLPQSHQCWQWYLSTLDRIEEASGENLDALRDGDVSGAPYLIDENEGESSCVKDTIGVWTGGKLAGVTSGPGYFDQGLRTNAFNSLRYLAHSVNTFNC